MDTPKIYPSVPASCPSTVLTGQGPHPVLQPQVVPSDNIWMQLPLMIVSIMKSTIMCRSPRVRDSALLGPASDKIRREAVGNQLVHPLHPHYPMHKSR